MKLILTTAILLVCLGITGCTQSAPKFNDKMGVGRVVGKKCAMYSGVKSLAIYELEHKDENGRTGWGPIRFRAPNSFAEVGDYIICSNNTIRSYKPEVME